MPFSCPFRCITFTYYPQTNQYCQVLSFFKNISWVWQRHVIGICNSLAYVFCESCVIYMNTVTVFKDCANVGRWVSIVSHAALLLVLRRFNLVKEQRSCARVVFVCAQTTWLISLNDLPQPHYSRFACHAALYNIF